MDTKEEILLKQKDGFLYIDKSQIDGDVGGVYNAMDEYAKQECIEFANFIKDNNYTKRENGWYKYYTKVESYPQGYGMSLPVYEFLTIDDIHNLFLQSKK